MRVARLEKDKKRMRREERNLEIHGGRLDKFIASVFFVVLGINEICVIQIAACSKRNDSHRVLERSELKKWAI
jgi:hypothetical protein